MDIYAFTKANLKDSKGILLYGAGGWGKIVLETLQSWIEKDEQMVNKNIPIIFIDRLKTSFEGIKVIKREEIKEYKDYDILLCAPSAYKEIITDLRNEFDEERMRHVFDIDKIVEKPEPRTYVTTQDCQSGEMLLEKYNFYKNRETLSTELGEVVLPFLAISVTERCSLNCDKCIALVPYYKNPRNFMFEDCRPALDRLINAVDKILELSFVGGEVFMNPEFYKWVEWAVNKTKIKTISIITNSTIIPDEQIIELLKHEKVVFGIDDYGSLSTKKEELIALAEREQIKYFIFLNEYWQDIGTLTRKNYSEQKKNAIFMNCSFKDCCLFLNGKIYRCQHEAHLDNLGVCVSSEEDCLDMRIERNCEELKEKLVKLMKKDRALDACDFCNDITASIRRIPVAEQRIRK